MATVKIQNLEAELQAILKQEETDIYRAMEEATRVCTKKAKEHVKELSKQKFNANNSPSNGRYYTGWKTRVENGRTTTQGVIYNEKYAGLPHLLEKGHALRQGGRTKGRPHVEPTQEYIDGLFQDYIQRYVEGRA